MSYDVASKLPEYRLPKLEYTLQQVDHIEDHFELATALYRDPTNEEIKEVRIKRCKFGPLSPWVRVEKGDVVPGDRIRFRPKKSAAEDRMDAREKERQAKLGMIDSLGLSELVEWVRGGLWQLAAGVHDESLYSRAPQF